jgi:hypothetical protein
MRRVHDGRAAAMHLYLIHRNIALQGLLAPVLPGAQWELREPTHLKASKAAGRVLELAGRIVGYLRELPAGTRKVPTKHLRDFLGLDGSPADKMAFSRAIAEVTDTGHGWAREGQSLVRRDGEYYFAEA